MVQIVNLTRLGLYLRRFRLPIALRADGHMVRFTGPKGSCFEPAPGIGQTLLQPGAASHTRLAPALVVKVPDDRYRCTGNRPSRLIDDHAAQTTRVLRGN